MLFLERILYQNQRICFTFDDDVSTDITSTAVRRIEDHSGLRREIYSPTQANKSSNCRTPTALGNASPLALTDSSQVFQLLHFHLWTVLYVLSLRD